jgi:Flp pilus assembly protein TadD
VAAVPVLASVPRELKTPSQRTGLEDGVDENRAAQMVSSDRPGAHVAIGIVHAQLGNFEAARRAYETALSVGPYFVPAYVNLADLHRLEHRDDEAEPLLRKALTIAPDSAEAHHALGLLLARRRKLEEAVAALRRAAELDAAQPEYAYVYAIALNSTGRPEAALDTLEAALRRHPGDGQILAALATINGDRGSFEQATVYARRLVELRPQDPWARQLLQHVRATSEARQ